MDWNDLRYVLAIARDGTLLSAASALGVSHTTVGRRVKALEEEVGVLLFDRRPDGWIPTAAGADLVGVAERVEQEVLSAEGRVLGRDEALSGQLRVSTVDVLFYGFAQAFAEFTRRYPSIDLTITSSSETVSLTRREADVSLRLSNAPPDYLVGRKLGYVQFGVYASVELVERVGEGAPLGAFPWIGWDGARHERWFVSWLAEHAPGARIVLRIDNEAPLVAHAVREGIGAQILPCFFADPDSTLTRIAPLDDAFRLDLWLLTLDALRGNSRVRAFMAHMGDALEARAAALAGTPR